MKFREEKIRGKTIELSSKVYKEKIRNKKVLDIFDFFVLSNFNILSTQKKAKNKMGVIE